MIPTYARIYELMPPVIELWPALGLLAIIGSLEIGIGSRWVGALVLGLGMTLPLAPKLVGCLGW